MRKNLFLIAVLFAAQVLAAAEHGYFRTENRGGVWWLIGPNGQPTLSIGVDQIAYMPDRIRGTGPSPYQDAVEKIYSDRRAWGRAALERLKRWGFNTIGAWSDHELWEEGVSYTVILDIAARSGADWQHGKPADVFARRFEQTARQLAGLACAPRSRDRSLVGYFSDNELRWGPDWRGKETMLQMYLELPAGAPGRQRALDFLRQRYANNIAKLNGAWETNAKDFDSVSTSAATDAFKSDAEEFLARVAARYFDVCAQEIHHADPNHLYLGARFAGQVPDAVLRGARAADVVSVNIYRLDPRPVAEHIFQTAGRPVLIGEFAFRAEDSGLPNTKGAGPKVQDQPARAQAYRDYVNALVGLPEVVGYHWFKWTDEPKEGRFDGENSNYGLVDIQDRPYAAFVEVIETTNEAAFESHRKSARPSER